MKALETRLNETVAHLEAEREAHAQTRSHWDEESASLAERHKSLDDQKKSMESQRQGCVAKLASQSTPSTFLASISQNPACCRLQWTQEREAPSEADSAFPETWLASYSSHYSWPLLRVMSWIRTSFKHSWQLTRALYIVVECCGMSDEKSPVC